MSELLGDGFCGCGMPVRYMGKDGGACNKYSRCMTYDQLSDKYKKAQSLLNAYREKRAVDGLNGRKWCASDHFEAEARIEALEGT